MPTFTYNFGTGFDLTITTNGLTTDPHGSGFDITSISGTFFGDTVTGLFPASGDNLFNNNIGAAVDNIIFDGNANGDHGSAYGIDLNGIGFTIDLGGGSVGYVDLFSNSGGNPALFSAQTLINQEDSNPNLNANFNSVITTGGVPCYCPGTLIKTARGYKPVEKLKIGDMIMTASGALRPIKWIGRRSYGGRFIMGRTDILPVCIKAGALDDNVPRRDLWISPHHAMYFEDNLDGVLIEAKDLVNGVSIVQAERVEKIEYFHIELDTHDVIIAEGALSESFIDDDSRGTFHNAHEYRLLYPAAASLAAQYCAPRLDEGYEVEAIRQRLAARAGLAPSDKTTETGALRGYIDRITPRVIEGWAQNADHPEAPVCLDIVAGGRLLGQVLANHYREDLEQAGMGSGRHSFAFALPPGFGLMPDAIEVRRSLDGAALDFTVEAWRRFSVSENNPESRRAAAAARG
jgi:Hint domain